MRISDWSSDVCSSDLLIGSITSLVSISKPQLPIAVVSPAFYLTTIQQCTCVAGPSSNDDRRVISAQIHSGKVGPHLIGTITSLVFISKSQLSIIISSPALHLTTIQEYTRMCSSSARTNAGDNGSCCRRCSGCSSWSCCRRCSGRSEEHTSELQSLMRISYAVFCLKKKKSTKHTSQLQSHMRITNDTLRMNNQLR